MTSLPYRLPRVVVDLRNFTALILLVAVTTMMATPTLSWLDARDRRRGPTLPAGDFTGGGGRG